MAFRSAILAARTLLREQRGNALALTALAMPLLIGCAGLAVDTIQWTYAKRDLQAAVDAAAMAGVYGIIQGGDMDVAVDRSLASNHGAGLDDRTFADLGARMNETAITFRGGACDLAAQ